MNYTLSTEFLCKITRQTVRGARRTDVMRRPVNTRHRTLRIRRTYTYAKNGRARVFFAHKSTYDRKLTPCVIFSIFRSDVTTRVLFCSASKKRTRTTCRRSSVSVPSTIFPSARGKRPKIRVKTRYT